MKNLIIEKLEELGGNVSFVDLEDLPGFAGDGHIGRFKYNFIYWVNVSQLFSQVINELVWDGVVTFDRTDPITYLIDGCTLSMPVFEDGVSCDSPRWLPVVLNKGPNFYQD